MMDVVAAISTELNGFGSCGCDHWRDARTMWIIGWVGLAVVFAVVVYVISVRARRRSATGVDEGPLNIPAKRRHELDGAVSWERGALRFHGGVVTWHARDVPDPIVLVSQPVRRGPAVGASQFPFTVSVIVRAGIEDAMFAVRPGDDVALVERSRRTDVSAARPSP